MRTAGLQCMVHVLVLASGLRLDLWTWWCCVCPGRPTHPWPWLRAAPPVIPRTRVLTRLCLARRPPPPPLQEGGAKLEGVDLGRLLTPAATLRPGAAQFNVMKQDHGLEYGLDVHLVPLCKAALPDDKVRQGWGVCVPRLALPQGAGADAYILTE